MKINYVVMLLGIVAVIIAASILLSTKTLVINDADLLTGAVALDGYALEKTINVSEQPYEDDLIASIENSPDCEFAYRGYVNDSEVRALKQSLSECRFEDSSTGNWVKLLCYSPASNPQGVHHCSVASVPRVIDCDGEEGYSRISGFPDWVGSKIVHQWTSPYEHLVVEYYCPV